MERNNLVLYLDIPEFSEALYASKWHPDAVRKHSINSPFHSKNVILLL